MASLAQAKGVFLGQGAQSGLALRNASALRTPSSASVGTGPCPCKRRQLAAPRAIDEDTLVGIGVGLAGIAVGVGIPLFYELQVKGSEKRENDQPCFPCSGTGSQQCRFCGSKGVVVVELGGGETESSTCINCEGRGSIICTTCQGTGTQPRYLDRREFKDDD